VGGYVPSEPPLRGQCWGGLGLIVVDAGGSFARAHRGGRTTMTPLSDLVWPVAETMEDDPVSERGSQGAGMSAELERHRAAIEAIESSLSWRITAPLRTARARFGRR